MMEIADSIHRIDCRFGGNRMIFVHLLIGQKASILIDTGVAHNPEAEILPYMQSIGFDPTQLTYIVMSHSDVDHQGGNLPMKKVAPNAKFLGHRLDRPWLDDTESLIKGRYSQFEEDHGIGYGEEGKAGIRADCLSVALDMTLEGGEEFCLSDDWWVEIIHTPGHTWGHLAVYDPRSKTLIAGEASLWNAILDTEWKPAMPPTYCYVDTYLATQDRLLGMDIDLFSPAHWPIQKGNAVGEFIRESRNYCLHVEQSLLNFAKQGSFTLRQAIEMLAPTLGNWPSGTNQDFSYGMLGNLDSLTKRGQLVVGRTEDGLMNWSLPK